MERSFSRSVQTDGREIRYCLERKAVRNLNLRIRTDGTVFVSANDDVPFAEIDGFVCKKASYIDTGRSTRWTTRGGAREKW